MMSRRLFIILAVSLIVRSHQYVTLRSYLSISNTLRFTSKISMSMDTTDDLISIRKAVDSEPSESTVMVAKSLHDGVLIPGIVARNIRGESIVQKKAPGYEKIKKALLNYKYLKGDMLVPQKFVVPADDNKWPKEMEGMNLGTLVNRIRAGKSCLKKRADLESIGFDFDLQKLSYGYETIRAALLKYKDLIGNMLVPQTFVVPANYKTWPEEMSGMNLGTIVRRIRAGTSWSKNRADLESIGFDFDLQKLSYGYETIRAALLKYKDLNGDMLVPQTFVVPANDDLWPKEMSGMKLGIGVMSIRGGNSWSKKRADLESIGFDFNSQELGYGYETIRAALLKYKDLNGDMLVPAKFVVPANDIKWPEETSGIKLGTIVRNLRAGKTHLKNRADLESIGFDFNLQRLTYGYDKIRAALLKYKELKGNLLVPQIFMVPANDAAWPKEMSGMKLGATVMSIRGGNAWSKNRADLQSIGFIFNH